MPAFGTELDLETRPAAKPHRLAYTDDVARKTDGLYETVARVMPRVEWELHAPYIAAINDLKIERNAVILAHNYMTPEIFACVGDFRGDSLALAKEAAKTNAAVIVQGGVHFMAETSKILAPEKTVLMPDMAAGCSLASSITGEDVRMLKARYPGVPVVTYVNTSAEVKAESDVCCTSSNAVDVVEAICAEWGVSRVLLLPDQYLAKNVAAMTEIEVITWAGACEVHETFTADDIRELRAAHPDAKILAHPECPPDVLAEADFAGSTGAMSSYVSEKKPGRVVLITECSMSDNVSLANPQTEFVRPCNLCPHMKRITLPAILKSLETMTTAIEIDADIAERARAAVQKMVDLPAPVRSRSFTVDRVAPVAVEHRP
ncbi:MAG: quinolinate synthase NadA [Pseudomonadota bacterium]